jgi:hypothetical protein
MRAVPAVPLQGLRAVVVAVVIATAGGAHADDNASIIGDSGYHLSAFYMNGGYAFTGRTSRFQAMGLRLSERDGIVAGGVLTALLAIPALASNSPNKHVGTDYVYTPNATYRVDWYRAKTAEEREADQRATEGLLGWMYYSRHQFDIELFIPQKDVTQARGIGVSFMWASFGRRTVFELGAPKFRYITDREGGERYRVVEYGAPLRLWVPATSWLLFRFDATLGGTWASHQIPMMDNETQFGLVPVAAGLTAGTERLFVSAGVSTHIAGELLGKFGANAEAGVRF